MKWAFRCLLLAYLATCQVSSLHIYQRTQYYYTYPHLLELTHFAYICICIVDRAISLVGPWPNRGRRIILEKRTSINLKAPIYTHKRFSSPPPRLFQLRVTVESFSAPPGIPHRSWHQALQRAVDISLEPLVECEWPLHTIVR